MKSSYWNDFEQQEFVLNSSSWRTETFDWIRDELPSDDKTAVSILSQNFDLDESDIQLEQINAFVAYSSSSASNEIKLLRYESPQVKSSNSRVKTVLVNPTKYWIYPTLVKYQYGEEVDYEFSGNSDELNNTFAKKGSNGECT